MKGRLTLLFVLVAASALAAPGGRPPARKQESGGAAKGFVLPTSETAVLDRSTTPLFSKQESGR